MKKTKTYSISHMLREDQWDKSLHKDIIYIDHDPGHKDKFLFMKSGCIAINTLSKHAFIYVENKEKEPEWRFIGIVPDNTVEKKNDPLFLKSKKTCPICNLSAETTLHEHHIDRNRDNNSPDNLIILCPLCHQSTHTFINAGLSEGGALRLTKILGNVLQNTHVYNFKAGISRKEEIDRYIVNAFAEEGIAIDKFSLGFHNTRRHRLYCEVHTLDYDFVKNFCSENGLQMGEFVYLSIIDFIIKHEKLKNQIN